MLIEERPAFRKNTLPQSSGFKGKLNKQQEALGPTVLTFERLPSQFAHSIHTASRTGSVPATALEKTEETVTDIERNGERRREQGSNNSRSRGMKIFFSKHN